MEENEVVDVAEVLPTSVEEVSQLWTQVQDVVAAWGLKVVAALAIFIIGRWIAMMVRRGVRRMMEKSGADPIIIGFVTSIAYIALLAFVVIAALGQLGIQTTSFIAILGAAGLAVGFWSGQDELRQNWAEDKTWQPSMTVTDREKYYREWKKAVDRTFDWMD